MIMIAIDDAISGLLRLSSSGCFVKERCVWSATQSTCHVPDGIELRYLVVPQLPLIVQMQRNPSWQKEHETLELVMVERCCVDSARSRGLQLSSCAGSSRV